MKLNKLNKEVSLWRKKKGFKTDWGNMPEKLMLVVCIVFMLSMTTDRLDGYRDGTLVDPAPIPEAFRQNNI